MVAVDQLTKWWALVSLDDRDIDLVWTLRLNLVHNTGAAFGLGQGLEAVIAGLALVFVAVVAWASWGPATDFSAGPWSTSSTFNGGRCSTPPTPPSWWPG